MAHGQTRRLATENFSGQTEVACECIATAAIPGNDHLRFIESGL